MLGLLVVARGGVGVYIYTTQHRLMKWDKWDWLVVAMLLNAHEHGNCD